MPQGESLDDYGSPAWAGIDLIGLSATGEAEGFPRVGGDRPF